MKRILLTTFVLFATLFGNVNGQVIFKNSGWTKIYIAYCFFDNRTGWTSKGWYPVEPNEEKALYAIPAFGNPNFYYCARIDKCDKGYFGEFPINVDIENAFTIPNADKDINSQNPQIKKLKFRKVNLSGKQRLAIEIQPINITCYNNYHGKWRFSLDRDFEFAEKKEDAVYFREITFDSGKPLGWCKDFYNDSLIKAEYKLKSFNPFVYDGKCTWYKRDGSIEKVATFQNGNQISETAVSEEGIKTSKKLRYETVKFPIQNFYINSTSNETWKGGKSKTVYPIELPKGTVEWYYEFTCARDQSVVNANKEQFSLASQLSSLVDKTGLLSASINLFTAPPGADFCDIYLFDQSSYSPFLKGEEFIYNTTGSRLNFKSGIVQVRKANIRVPMLGIRNNDGYNGIHVSIQVVAVVSKLDE